MVNFMVKEHSLCLDGKNYVGEFRNGIFNGQGTYTFLDG